MPSEHTLSQRVMEMLSEYGHAARVENGVPPYGMPDINYCIQGVEGWVENKWRGFWPVSPEGIVTIDHFTKQQRLWHRTRARAGGRTWVMLRVDGSLGAEFMLFRGLWAAEFLGKVTREAMMDGAMECWTKKIAGRELVKALTRPM